MTNVLAGSCVRTGSGGDRSRTIEADAALSTPGVHPTREVPRLFVAVPLPEAARSAVEELIAPIAATTGSGSRTIRWVRLDGLHLTLRFLGPTAFGRVAAVEAAVRSAAVAQHPFRIVIHGAGAFPSPTRPRALWLGLDEGVAELSRLYDRLQDSLSEAGWTPDDRPFRPHLTLARSDGVPNAASVVAALREAASGFSFAFEADRLVLFESITGGGPARYVPLAEAPFES
jgi:2'-5' RNA ligase